MFLSVFPPNDALGADELRQRSERTNACISPPSSEGHPKASRGCLAFTPGWRKAGSLERQVSYGLCESILYVKLTGGAEITAQPKQTTVDSQRVVQSPSRQVRAKSMDSWNWRKSPARIVSSSQVPGRGTALRREAFCIQQDMDPPAGARLSRYSSIR